MCESDSITDRLVIPFAEAREIVGGANRLYLRPCPCRVSARQCPADTWEVCLLFENAPQADLHAAWAITQAEALAVLQASAERGEIHNLFFRHTTRSITELCNCCHCCCEPLRDLKAAGSYAEQLRSGYVAVTDEMLCTACGECQASCYFEARQLENDGLHLIDERCFGCGKCVASCPQGAIRLEFQAGRGIGIPTNA
jgi:electron transport complex protein RnfB